MFKFFRIIRKNLLEEGKTGKYLKYAIGEILLVTIGILIALKINNLNEQSKLHSKEILTLIDIQNDLEVNIRDLKKGISHIVDFQLFAERIMKCFETHQPYKKEMNGWFGQFFNIWNPKFSSGAYDNLKTTGLSIISNKNVRGQIINVFDGELTWIDQALTERQYRYNESVVLPMITKYLNCEGDKYWDLTPSDYELMMRDQSFYNMCSILKMYYGRDLDHSNNALLAMEKLNKSLEKEIHRLNDK